MDGPIPVIDRDAGRPIGVQLVEGLRRGILDGALRPGDAVPSTRALAAELGVVAQRGRRGLRAARRRGLPRDAPGRAHPGRALTSPGPRAAPGPPSPDALDDGARARAVANGGFQPPRPAVRDRSTGWRRRTGPLQRDAAGAPAPPRIDLLPGRPSTARIDTRAWRAAWRHAAALDIPSESPPPFGVQRLRAEIADHLRLARGVACAPDDVVVTAGTAEALALVASALGLLVGGATARRRRASRATPRRAAPSNDAAPARCPCRSTATGSTSTRCAGCRDRRTPSW